MNIEVAFALLVSTALIAVSPQAQAKGGMSGGGGNVIAPRSPDRYQDPDHVEDMIKYSRTHLLNYLGEKEKDYQSNQMNENERALFEPLFAPDRHVESVIQSVKIHIEDEHPCYDETYSPVDGSFIVGRKEAVCMSSFNLARKVHKDEMIPQATALLLHEYTELMGASEDHAVAIQKQALQDLSGSTGELKEEK